MNVAYVDGFYPCFLLSASLGTLARLQVELLVVACWMVQEEEEEEGWSGHPLIFPPPSPSFHVLCMQRQFADTISCYCKTDIAITIH